MGRQTKQNISEQLQFFSGQPLLLFFQTQVKFYDIFQIKVRVCRADITLYTSTRLPSRVTLELMAMEIHNTKSIPNSMLNRILY